MVIAISGAESACKATAAVDVPQRPLSNVISSIFETYDAHLSDNTAVCMTAPSATECEIG